MAQDTSEEDLAGAASSMDEQRPPGQAEPARSSFLSSFRERTFRSFRYRDFRLQWIGAFTSTTGTWTQQIAQAWLVYQMTGSPFYLGLTAFLGELPFILFTLIGGAAADRIERRKLLLGSQYVQMASAFTLTALVYWDVIAIWHFLVLVFVVGTAQAFGGPAYQALIPTLVNREDLPNAIALNSIQFNLARMIGPLLAGVMLEWVGPVYCFALNGLSFIAVIISLNLIQTRFRPKGSSNSVLRDIQQGLSYLLRRNALWQLSLLGFVSAFCAIPLLTMMPVFAGQVFGAEARVYSYLMACSGAGSVAGALLYAHFSHLQRRGLATLVVQLLFSGFLASFALSRFLPLSFVLLFLGGMSMMILIASINSLVQLAVDEKMRGRVSSIFMLSFRGAMPLGNLLTGVAATAFSPTAALLVNSLVLCSCALIFLLGGSRVRRL